MNRLLVLAPMAIEEAAVRNAGRVLRTGMGPERARIAAARAQAIDAAGVAVAGLCGGAKAGLHAGDVVCATELRRENGTTVSVPGSALLAAALRRHGLRVHVGPLHSADRVLTPRERAQLDGALAVDMESAWLADAAGGRPLAVLRVVVDAAGRRLADPRIAADGVRALRSLRRSSAVLAEWAGAIGPRKVLLAGPRSFCAGEVAREADIVLVAGSQTSSSSKRLVEVAEREGARAYLVDDETDVDVAWLYGASTVGVTAGASAPERIVDRLVGALAALGPVDVEERVTTGESLRFMLPKELVS